MAVNKIIDSLHIQTRKLETCTNQFTMLPLLPDSESNSVTKWSLDQVYGLLITNMLEIKIRCPLRSLWRRSMTMLAERLSFARRRPARCARTLIKQLKDTPRIGSLKALTTARERGPWSNEALAALAD
jgi:hypothetical protein